jgi:hypothetical protein
MFMRLCLYVRVCVRERVSKVTTFSSPNRQRRSDANAGGKQENAMELLSKCWRKEEGVGAGLPDVWVDGLKKFKEMKEGMDGC